MLQPIEMLYTSSTNGELTPIRFRIDINDEWVVVKVKNSMFLEETRLAGIRRRVYAADLIINSAIKREKLHYEYESCRWFVYNENYKKEL